MSQTQLRLQETQKLISEKDKIESDIQEHEAILRQQKVDLKTPLIDAEGFPRADLDIYQITTARAALARLYNDLKEKMNEIQLALEEYHRVQRNELVPTTITEPTEAIPFATVHSVANESPAMEAGLKEGDLIYKFGNIDFKTVNALQTLGSIVMENEFKTMKVHFLRDRKKEMLILIPKPWPGRGLLGCHLLPI